MSCAARKTADMEKNCSECSKITRQDKCKKCIKCYAVFHKDCNKTNIIIDAANFSVLYKKCVEKVMDERDSIRAELNQEKSKSESLNAELLELRTENVELKKIIAKITSIEDDLKWLKEQVKSNYNRQDRSPSLEQSPNPNPHLSNSNLEQKIYDSFYEITNRESRKLNLVIKGLSENGNDVTKINELFKHELATEIDPANLQCKRIGRQDRLPRPLLVTLPNMTAKRQILSNASNLRNYRTADQNKVFISPDLTPKQREANKALRDQLKEMRNLGQSVKIYKGQIVPANHSASTPHPHLPPPHTPRQQ